MCVSVYIYIYIYYSIIHNTLRTKMIILALLFPHSVYITTAINSPNTFSAGRQCFMQTADTTKQGATLCVRLSLVLLPRKSTKYSSSQRQPKTTFHLACKATFSNIPLLRPQYLQQNKLFSSCFGDAQLRHRVPKAQTAKRVVRMEDISP